MICGSFSREVKLIQKNLKQLQADSNRRDSKLYKNMFAHMTRDTPVATKVSGVSLILLPRRQFIYIWCHGEAFFPASHCEVMNLKWV